MEMRSRYWWRSETRQITANDGYRKKKQVRIKSGQRCWGGQMIKNPDMRKKSRSGRSISSQRKYWQRPTVLRLDNPRSLWPIVLSFKGHLMDEGQSDNTYKATVVSIFRVVSRVLFWSWCGFFDSLFTPPGCTCVLQPGWRRTKSCPCEPVDFLNTVTAVSWLMKPCFWIPSEADVMLPLMFPSFSRVQ